MAPTKPSKTLLKKLKKSHIRVEGPSGVAYHVTPVKELKDPVERYLPPAGQYYDQSAFGAIDLEQCCVLCLHMKHTGQECKCTEKCILCRTKQHRHRDCSRIYASIKWWQSHGHHLRKRAQLRPILRERAYLVVAGVYKDWERLEDPVVVNLEHPVVKAFYKGKDAPSALTDLPRELRPKPAAIDLSTGSGVDEASPTTGLGVAIGSAPALTFVETSTGELDSPRNLNASALNSSKTNDFEDRSQTPPVSPEEDDSFLGDLLEDTWQPSTYHEGTRYATVTPLSIRLALATAQQFSTSLQATVSTRNDVRTDLDPRLRVCTPQQDTPGGLQSLSECIITHGSINGANHSLKAEEGCAAYHGELQRAHEEIRAKDRRIRELELALHESEGWTDAVTYRGGQKRPRL
jgi:hypothetical protein